MTLESTPLNPRVYPSSNGSFDSLPRVRSFTRVHKKRFPALAFVAALVLLVATNTWKHGGNTQPAIAGLEAKSIFVTTTNGVEVERFCGATKQDAGYIKLPNKKDDKYFFWYFQARHHPETAPLILFLTGGPGASSMLALLLENGPCRVLPDLSTELNPHSWTDRANVVWLDQPTNVGFSYSPEPQDADNNEDNVAENIYWFLQGFLERHSKLQGREFFIAGESYGGHYVPSAAHYIAERNAARQPTSDTKHINLQGISIGNGDTNPAIQHPHFIDMATNSYNISLVDEDKLPELQLAAVECGRRIERCQTHLAECDDPEPYCYENLDSVFLSAKRNPFDIREPCDAEDIVECIPTGTIAQYLDSPNLREFLGVDERVGQWQMYNVDLNAAFSASLDPVKSVSSQVADLLDSGVRVLIYAGDADLQCNWSGNLAWLQKLEWTGEAGFTTAKQRPMTTSDGVNAGAVISSGPLTFLRVYNAGHMVPQDQPAVASEMIIRFIRNQTF